jgi:membrane-associated HD superfamily phosphohydrolase
MSMDDVKKGLSLALDNPVGALSLLKAETELQCETVEFKAGKIFLAGFVIGFLAASILAYAV